MKKYLYIIIIALIAIITLQEYQKRQIIKQYTQEIDLIQDMAADACDDAIAEILKQF